MNASFLNLTNGLLPFHKRQPKRLAFLRVFADKADYYMSLIKAFRSEALMLVYTNCQRYRLEKHLNDVFDKTLRRILVNDNEDIGGVIGLETETDFLVIGMESETDFFETLGFYAEQGSLSNEIRVIVPVGTNSNMVLDDVNKYKLAGIKVTIQN